MWGPRRPVTGIALLFTGTNKFYSSSFSAELYACFNVDYHAILVELFATHLTKSPLDLNRMMYARETSAHI
jgi:hypothetical protein